MFRWLRRPRRTPAPQPPPLLREIRTPDPYVWPLLSPYDARWRRWATRSRAAGRHLPFPEPGPPPPPPLPPAWHTTDDVVRPYVLRP